MYTTPMDRAQRAALLGSSVAVAIAAALSVSSNVPRLWAPFSLLSVIPNMVFAEMTMGFFAELGPSPGLPYQWRYVDPETVDRLGMLGSALFFGPLFLVWSWRRARLDRIPPGSAIAFGTIGILNAWMLTASWSYGVTYQGTLHTVVTTAYNFVATVACIALYLRNRRAPSWGTNLAFHRASFAAVAFCSFPWLGELL